MLISAFFRAMNMHLIHGLAKKNHPFVTIHYSHIGFFVLNSVMCNVHPVKISWDQIGWFMGFVLAAIVVTAILSQYSIFLANSLRSPSLVMPFGYASVVVSFLADVYLFDTDFSLLPVVGMLLTSAGLMSGYLKDSAGKEVKKEEQKKIEG